jgi:hypothetical protein
MADEKLFRSSSDPMQDSAAILSNSTMKDDAWEIKMAESLDPQVLFGDAYEAFLEKRQWCQPRPVDVMEISQYGVGDSMSFITKSFSMAGAQLYSWLKSSDAPSNDEGQKASGGLRLIMGASNPAISPSCLPAEFPHQMNGVGNYQPLPFKRGLLNAIVEEFHLPLATEWVFATNHSHFVRIIGSLSSTPNCSLLTRCFISCTPKVLKGTNPSLEF